MLLEYLRRHPPTPCRACRGRGCEECGHTGLTEYVRPQATPREPGKRGCLGRLIGGLCLAYWRCPYRPPN